MASKELKIPTIVFSKEELKPGTSQWDSTKDQVFQALQEYGCFEAIYDNVIPSETRESMFGTLKEIFEFPIEIKLKNLSDKPLQGYLGQIPHLPLYESLSISDLLQSQNAESFVNIFWPDDGNPEFCNVIKSYSKSHVELDQMVKMMVLESLGLTNYVNDEFLEPNNFYLRFSHYKAPTQGQNIGNKVGLSGHTDVTVLSIISQNQVNGLQVFKKNGDDQWIDVNIAPNSFLVLSGDPFMAWTNGRVHSPIHRVTMAGESDRFSIQLSSLPNGDYTIKSPKELVDEEHPLLFKPYESVEYFKYVMSEAGQKTGTGVFKAYCGV